MSFFKAPGHVEMKQTQTETRDKDNKTVFINSDQVLLFFFTFSFSLRQEKNNMVDTPPFHPRSDKISGGQYLQDTAFLQPIFSF